jgi:hypothetical protein
MVILTRLHLLTLEQAAGWDVSQPETVSTNCSHATGNNPYCRSRLVDTECASAGWRQQRCYNKQCLFASAELIQYGLGPGAERFLIHGSLLLLEQRELIEYFSTNAMFSLN